jgi:hypothetical protein
VPLDAPADAPTEAPATGGDGGQQNEAESGGGQ